MWKAAFARSSFMLATGLYIISVNHYANTKRQVQPTLQPGHVVVEETSAVEWHWLVCWQWTWLCIQISVVVMKRRRKHTHKSPPNVCLYRHVSFLTVCVCVSHWLDGSLSHACWNQWVFCFMWTMYAFTPHFHMPHGVAQASIQDEMSCV